MAEQDGYLMPEALSQQLIDYVSTCPLFWCDYDARIPGSQHRAPFPSQLHQVDTSSDGIREDVTDG